MSKRKNVLFIKHINASFIQTDIKILEESYHVITFLYDGTTVLKNIGSILRMILFFVSNFYQTNLVFCWFADYHSFVTVLLSRIFFLKSIVVLGGYDVVALRKYNYGALNHRLRRFAVKRSLSWCTSVITVSHFIEEKLKQNLKVKISQKYVRIYNCVDTTFWKHSLGKERRNQVICVSLVGSFSTFKIKGIDFLFEVANQCPEIDFIWVGNMLKELPPNLSVPSNLVIKEKSSREELKGYLYESKAIVQFSLSESFCVAMAEGMACGLVPVTFNDLGSSELFEATSGFAIRRDLKAATSAIAKAIEMQPIWEDANKLRIDQVFSYELRREKLMQLIDKVMG